MHTFRFHFNGRDRFIDAETIFDAMVKFHALYEDILINELLITKMA